MQNKKLVCVLSLSKKELIGREFVVEIKINPVFLLFLFIELKTVKNMEK